MVDTECVRSKTANLFLASQTAVRPDDLLPSGAAHHSSQQYQDSIHHTPGAAGAVVAMHWSRSVKILYDRPGLCWHG